MSNMHNIKSAEEMFSDLGFNHWDYPGTISYSIPSDDNLSSFPDVDFEFDDKEVRLFRHGDMVTVNMVLFKVIQKKLEELGWLE